MATKITTEYECDGPYKSHAEPDTIVTVSMGMSTPNRSDMVELDLCSLCYDRWEKGLMPWVEAGRTLKRQPQTKGIGDQRVRSASNGHRPQARMDKHQSASIRTWAREHGAKVSDRGRIPEQVMQDYQAAHATRDKLALV